MTQGQKPKPDFEQRLLTRLKAVVAERGAAAAAGEAAEAQVASPSWRRHGPRLALGAATALVAVAVALIVGAGGDNPPAAFAVEAQEGGGVTIKIYSLSDASGLERALAQAGIPSQVTWLTAGMACREPHYKPSIVHLPGGGTLGSATLGGPGPMTFAVGSTQRWRESFGKYRRGEISGDEYENSMANLNLDPQAFRPDQSVVLSGSPAPYDGDPEGGSIAKVGIARGPVGPCQAVSSLDGSGPFGLPGSVGSGAAYVPKGDEALPQTAIAGALRQVAAAAETSTVPVEAPPAPGQFLYTKTKVVQLEGWLPQGHGKGSKTNPRYFVPIGDPSARYALVPTIKEVWTARDGATHVRETLGRANFLSSADQGRWEDAGSPPPWAFDPSEHDVSRDGSGRLVKEFASRSWRGRKVFLHVSQLAQAPTEPEALRLAVERRRGGSSPVDPSPADSPRGGTTVEKLLEFLSEPIASPALRAAAFNALAEIPGIGFERGAADVTGRLGDAIAWTRDGGLGRRYVFDPHTSKVLAQSEAIFDARAAGYPGIPDGTVFRETAYLQSGIVDSTQETVADAGDDPVATIDADRHR